MATKVLLVFLLLVAYVCAYNFVSNALGSNMVLQRAPKRANIWGWSKQAGSQITVVFNDKTSTTTSGTDGSWSLFLEPTAAGGPYTIQISSNIGETANLANILFGDVFVCSGQSNMQMTVHSVFNADDEIKDAANYPNIRVFTVGQLNTSTNPLKEFANIAQRWSVASSQSIGTGDWSEFSAACWFFGRNLYDNLKVPIGLFSDNWGGTPVQAWSSPDALTKCKQGNPDLTTGPNDPSQLWNAMIVPILPMTILGATWYQGESNAGQPNYYACAFPAMIADWRLKWGGDTDKDFGFYYVHLAPWLAGNNDAESLIRLSQLYANALPKVGFATAADLGDPTSPFGDIHPRGKQPVGLRLSLAARAITYGQNVQYLGPMAVSWSVVNQGVVEVKFDSKSVGDGLQVVAATCDSHVPPAQCAEYEVRTSAGWTAAKGAIAPGNTLQITASVGNNEITGVRYGYANYPLMTLRNSAGLPAIPFVFPNPITPGSLAGNVIENVY